MKTRRAAGRRLDDAIREGCGFRKSVDEGQAFPFTSVSFLSAAIYRSQDKLQVIAQWLKVEPQALRFGDQAVSAIREQRAKWQDPGFYQEREAIDAFLALPVEQRKVVREVIMAFARAGEVDEPSGTDGRKTR
ncbi:transcriptional regulator [Stutzerimonas nitrititolerans]|uniref:transcriptional regulator n=1 Tax=Stutzerimonas nitrititolerans TaxID=2482751 RepID=UPI0028AE7F83|nr:transcriptional regulator [Stutzerimonas nitrititolerans]